MAYKIEHSALIVDYIPAKECKESNYGMCHKCGKCGRRFEGGFMIDDGGTTPEEE